MLVCLLTAFAAPRVDFPMAEAKDFDVVPTPSAVVTFSQLRGPRSEYVIDGFDRQLQPLWSTRFRLGQPHDELLRDADPWHAWLLVERGWDSQVLRTRVTDGTVEAIPVLPAFRSHPNALVADDAGGAYVVGRRRAKSTVNWLTPNGTTRVVELGRKAVVADITTVAPGRVQATVLQPRAPIGAPIEIWDIEEGEISRRVELLPDARVSLLNGRVVPIADAEIAVGTWSSPSGSTAAEGLYVAKIEEGEPAGIQRFAFAELEHALDYLGPRRSARRQDRMDERAQAGRPVRLSWQVLLQDPVPTAAGFAVVAEAYVPRSETQQRMVNIPNGRGGTVSRMETYEVFAGWTFTHAVVVGFDRDGNRLYDHSLPLWVDSGELRSNVRVSADGDALVVVHPRGRQLRRVRIEGAAPLAMGEVVGERAVMGQGDVQAAWWYDDVFLLVGRERTWDEYGIPRRTRYLTVVE